MGQVTIEIAGRTYRMACDDGEEKRLKALGEAFDRTVSDLGRGFGEIGDRRLVVMAGLLATDDLAAARTRIEALEKERDALAARVAALEERLAADEGAAPRILEIAERIDRLAHALNDTVREDVAHEDAPE